MVAANLAYPNNHSTRNTFWIPSINIVQIKYKMSSTVQMDDGVRLNVKVLGEDPSRIKPLLIALHGAPGFSTHEEPEASFGFLSGPFRILVFDARGSGASDLIGPYNHERWIKDIEALRYPQRPSTIHFI